MKLTKQAELVVKSVGNALAVEPQEILGRTRSHRVCAARQLVCLLLRHTLGWDYTQIADLFHWKTHATAMYSCRVARESVDVYPLYRRIFNDLGGVL